MKKILVWLVFVLWPIFLADCAYPEIQFRVPDQAVILPFFDSDFMTGRLKYYLEGKGCWQCTHIFFRGVITWAEFQNRVHLVLQAKKLFYFKQRYLLHIGTPNKGFFLHNVDKHKLNLLLCSTLWLEKMICVFFLSFHMWKKNANQLFLVKTSVQYIEISYWLKAGSWAILCLLSPIYSKYTYTGIFSMTLLLCAINNKYLLPYPRK